MTGFFRNKYYVAIYNSDVEFLTRMFDTLKLLYNNKVVVQTYTDSYKMFEALNISVTNHKPFDIVVFSNNCIAQKMILSHTNPDLKVILCSDENALKNEVAKILQ